jgi:hypothetical protein
MKRLILVAVLLLTVSALSFAQSTTANITANVNATLSITRLTDLTIGNVNQGATVTIPSTVTLPADLTSGANTMPFTGQIPRWNTVAGAGTSTAFGALTGGATPTNGTGNLWVYIGGGVTAALAQAVGSYTGAITVAVTQP